MSGRKSEREFVFGSTERIARKKDRAIRVDDDGKLIASSS